MITAFPFSLVGLQTHVANALDLASFVPQKRAVFWLDTVRGKCQLGIVAGSRKRLLAGFRQPS